MQPALPVQAISPARICDALTARPIASMAAIASATLSSRHARNQKVLPDRQADFAVAEIARDLCKTAHLRAGHFAERQRNADPVQARLLLPVHADMRHAVEGRPRREGLRRHAGKGVAEFFLDQQQEFFHSHAVDHIFHPRLEAVGAIAGFDEHPHDGVGDLGGVRRPDDDAGRPWQNPGDR